VTSDPTTTLPEETSAPTPEVTSDPTTTLPEETSAPTPEVTSDPTTTLPEETSDPTTTLPQETAPYRRRLAAEQPTPASCCGGVWSSDCYDTPGLNNFNHWCKETTGGPCEGDCESDPGSDLCAQCCRAQEHNVDWNCDWFVADCPESYTEAVGSDCECFSQSCAANKYCYESFCETDPYICTESGSVANSDPCLCSDIACEANQYCYDDVCNAAAQSVEPTTTLPEETSAPTTTLPEETSAPTTTLPEETSAPTTTLPEETSAPAKEYIALNDGSSSSTQDFSINISELGIESEVTGLTHTLSVEFTVTYEDTWGNSVPGQKNRMRRRKRLLSMEFTNGARALDANSQFRLYSHPSRLSQQIMQE